MRPQECDLTTISLENQGSWGIIWRLHFPVLNGLLPVSYQQIDGLTSCFPFAGKQIFAPSATWEGRPCQRGGDVSTAGTERPAGLAY